MTTVPSANNQDPTLWCAYFGGPKDGFKTGDLPAELSGLSMEGTEIRSPMSVPHEFSLYAVYRCDGTAQVDGFWPFHFQGMEGPNGERLVAAEDPEQAVWQEDVDSGIERLAALQAEAPQQH
jgi:hypothetical protein